MKKIILGVLIAFVVIIGGCMAFMGATVNSVDQAIQETEQQQVVEKDNIQALTKDMKWEVESDGYSKTIVSTFENTTDKEIEYLQFDYKIFDKDGTVLESSMVFESDIAPGEKRKIEIFVLEEDFDSFEITATNNILE